MKHSVMLIAALCAFASAPELSAQSQMQADELFKWFPQGTYLSINHRDNALLRSGSAYPLYVKYFEPETEQQENAGESKESGKRVSFSPGGIGLAAADILQTEHLNLPPSMREAVVSTTTATALKLVDEPEDAKNAQINIKVGVAPQGGGDVKGSFVMIGKSDNMAVHRFDDLPGALAEALKRNEIAETGRKLGGRPVYSFSIGEKDDGDKDGGREYFAWADELGELLIAKDRLTLRKMYLTGTNRMMNLLDDPAYVDFVNLTPELGGKWNAHMPQAAFAQAVDSLELNNGDDERAARLRDRNKKSPLIRLSSLAVADSLISRTYEIYQEDEAAEEAYNRGDSTGKLSIGSNPMETFDEYQRMLSERRETELRGNMVVDTVAYDEKLLLAQQKADKALNQALSKGGNTLSFTTAGGKTLQLKMAKPVEVEGSQTKKKDKK